MKREQPFGTNAPEDGLPSGETNPADDADLADALDAAFTVMLKCLPPVERAVFLLREVFECDYIEVARIVEKSEDNCRQILRRARGRIAGRDPRFEVTREQQETVLREFLNATSSGDLVRLAKALAGDATLICDGENLGLPAPAPIEGAAAVCHLLVQKGHEWRSAGASLQPTVIGKFRSFWRIARADS